MRIPAREDIKIMKGNVFHPIQAPIMANNFTSPPPIPSFRVNHSKITAIRKRKPPPARSPMSESGHLSPIQPAKESPNPMSAPGREMTSGIIWWSRSMKLMTTRDARKAIKAGYAGLNP